MKNYKIFRRPHTVVQLYDLGLEKQVKINKKNNKLNYIKIKNFCPLKEHLKK